MDPITIDSGKAHHVHAGTTGMSGTGTHVPGADTQIRKRTIVAWTGVAAGAGCRYCNVVFQEDLMALSGMSVLA